MMADCGHEYQHYIDDDGNSRCGECHWVVVSPSVRSIPTEGGGYDIVTDK